MRKSLALALIAAPLLAGAASAQLAGGTSAQPKIVNHALSPNEVVAAQNGWCSALVNISETFASKGQAAAKTLAAKVIDEAYGYQQGAVLFKPTLTTAPHTFRTTKEGALSYFVGGDSAFPQDHGFAAKNWKKCEIENAGIFIAGDTATTMGNVKFTDKDGKVTVVDKTWVFEKDNMGKIRIMAHHSSLPYRGD